MNSIRSNLIAALIGAMIATLCAGGWATFVTTRNEVGDLFDYQLRQIALSLRDQTFQASAEALASDESLDYVIRVWDMSGLTVYSSRQHQSLPELTQLGYSTAGSDEGQWRVFAVQYHGMTIAVAQPMRVRDRLAVAAAWRTAKPFLILLPVLGVLLWILVSRGLQPLSRLAQLLKARSADSLEPLRAKDIPEEVEPLVGALNDLLVRLKTALDGQKAFIADAAHELRTPLTALQLQVQLIERAESDAVRQAALADLKTGLQRTAHTVQQMLELARQEPGSVEYKQLPVALTALVQEAVIDHEQLAGSRQIDLGVTHTDETAVISGDVEALRVLLANLVANAIRYTPVGGRVDVACGRDQSGSFLEVVDNGPGIPANERERVFDRFYRCESSDATVSAGSGLGLSIVQAIADRHRAKVVLDDAEKGGLRVTVRFTA